MDQPAPLTGKNKSVPVLTPTRQDWLFLAAVVVFGGSSFSAIKVAVDAAPPSVVAAGRLWVAAVLLIAYMVSTGRRFPPLIENRRIAAPWLFAVAIGAAGYSIPMFMFPYAQQTVSSLLAGIYMAFMPIVTVVLAALFAGEALTKNKILG
ncbi:MAG: DMT family transporter, partial [Pseudomonadota bacterium]